MFLYPDGSNAKIWSKDRIAHLIVVSDVRRTAPNIISSSRTKRTPVCLPPGICLSPVSSVAPWRLSVPMLCYVCYARYAMLCLLCPLCHAMPAMLCPLCHAMPAMPAMTVIYPMLCYARYACYARYDCYLCHTCYAMLCLLSMPCRRHTHVHVW